jgi:hypothetical protein
LQVAVLAPWGDNLETGPKRHFGYRFTLTDSGITKKGGSPNEDTVTAGPSYSIDEYSCVEFLDF